MYSCQFKSGVKRLFAGIFFFLISNSVVLASCSKNDGPETNPSQPKTTEKTAVVNGITLPSHPRLLFTKAEETKVKQLITTDALAKRLDALLTAQADKLVSTAQRTETAVSLTVSRDYLNRLFSLALAYRLHGDEKYATAVNETLIHVCSFSNWDPGHYLDVAEMTAAVAVAYDWLYDVLPSTTKSLVKASIYNKALLLAKAEYQNGTSGSWAKRETNWNVVCNSGMTLGALATAEDYSEIATDVVLNAAKYMPNCLQHFSPDGTCYEGPSYWEYTNIYLAMFIKAMNDNLGTDYGISSLGGVSKAALYYIKTLSPTSKVFNFADSNTTYASSSPLFFLFSKHFNQPVVANWYRNRLSTVVSSGNVPKWHFPLCLAWFDNATTTETIAAPKLETFHGINDIAVFHGQSDAAKPIFLIAKGADPDMAHQQLDGGTFIIESEGVRWTEDLGVDSYDIPGFWDYSPTGQRWNYFRNTSLSHNTISIDGKIQYSAGTAHISEEHASDSQPYVRLNMTTLYQGQAKNVVRQFKLVDSSTIEIQDEITLLNAGQEVCWSIVTPAAVSISGNKAVLQKDGKVFYMKILSPSNAVFSWKLAKPNTSYETAISGITMLQCITKPSTVNEKIVISLSSVER